MSMHPIGLVLEGGGMRGAFTAGVLDLLLDAGIRLDDVYGVSAGACQACSYLSGQRGRGIRVWLNYLNDPRFCSLSSLLKTGDMFDADFNYHLVPTQLDPIDNDAFLQLDAHFFAVVTSLETGEAEALPVTDMHRDIQAVRASASLPLISNIVVINGKKYLDGGIAMSIPLALSQRDGHRKNVVVLTQAAGYQKSPNRALPLIAARYARYPRFVQAARVRHQQYNDTLRLIEAERAAGRAFVLQPDTPPNVHKTEKDPAKLQALHDAGYAVAERQVDALRAFLAE